VTTLCCIIGLTLYLTALGQVAFTRILRLRVTREALQVRERELMEANDALHRNLREIDELQEQLREQANRDLTGLYNRRYLDSTLERELARCKRDGDPWRSSLSTSITSSRSTTPTAIRPATKSCSASPPCWLAWPGRGCGLPLRGEEFLLLMPTMPMASAGNVQKPCASPSKRSKCPLAPSN
jgi:hypothetical protein